MKRMEVLLAVFLAVVVTAALILWRYKKALARARDAVKRGGLIASTVCGPIEYAATGTGIPVLSIHGAGGGYDQGLANAADLVGDGFRVIAPSRFGYLRTPIPPDASPAAQADAHAALLSRLDIPKAIVVGVSAGARSAVELAIRHPDRVMALILVVPGTYSPTSPVSVEASRGSKLVFRLVNTGADFCWWALEKVAPSLLIRFIGVRPELVAASPKADRDRVTSIVRTIKPLSLRFPGINLDSTADLRPLPLGKITAPTLLLSARDDLFNTLPAAASRIPDARLIVFESGGHLLVGHDKEVRAAVLTFLTRAGATSLPTVAMAGPETAEGIPHPDIVS